MTGKRPTLAKSYEINPTKGVLIDGETVPWYTCADPMALVEEYDEFAHILWVPVLIEGPIPAQGRPSGEAVPR